MEGMKMKRVKMEMGGNEKVIIEDDEDVEKEIKVV